MVPAMGTAGWSVAHNYTATVAARKGRRPAAGGQCGRCASRRSRRWLQRDMAKQTTQKTTPAKT